MCKDRIEKAALSVKGVISAKWSTEDHILHLSYDEKKVYLDKVHKAIAAAGHDTEKVKASDSVYNELPGCCLYERLSYDQAKSSLKTSEFHVSGNCGMCKDRIEAAALTVKGVNEANWDDKTKILEIEYLANIDIIKVHQAIAKVGHDTKKVKAEDSIYNALPGCCLYREE
jgi:Cu(I)/Ag(I) efflux system membrane fusion protein